MREFFRYLYYRLYSWNLKKWGESDVPEGNALIGVTFMMLINIFFLVHLIAVFGLYDLYDHWRNTNDIYLWGFVYFGLLLINYRWLVHDRKYLQLPKKYEGESKHQRRRKMIFLWLYVVISFVANFAEAGLTRRLYGH